jgi:hypothetical protein
MRLDASSPHPVAQVLAFELDKDAAGFLHKQTNDSGRYLGYEGEVLCASGGVSCRVLNRWTATFAHQVALKVAQVCLQHGQILENVLVLLGGKSHEISEARRLCSGA